jgi:hypothetical protein
MIETTFSCGGSYEFTVGAHLRCVGDAYQKDRAGFTLADGQRIRLAGNGRLAVTHGEQEWGGRGCGLVVVRCSRQCD